LLCVVKPFEIITLLSSVEGVLMVYNWTQSRK